MASINCWLINKTDAVKFEKKIEGFKPQSKWKGKWVDRKPKLDFNRSDLTYKASTQKTFLKKSQMKTFSPPSKSPTEKWIFSGGRKSNYNAQPTKWVKRITSTNAQINVQFKEVCL